ncbi:unnamed protein product [Ectocarpus sp. 8 AP-2014]
MITPRPWRRCASGFERRWRKTTHTVRESAEACSPYRCSELCWIYACIPPHLAPFLFVTLAAAATSKTFQRRACLSPGIHCVRQTRRTCENVCCCRCHNNSANRIATSVTRYICVPVIPPSASIPLPSVWPPLPAAAAPSRQVQRQRS